MVSVDIVMSSAHLTANLVLQAHVLHTYCLLRFPFTLSPQTTRHPANALNTSTACCNVAAV
jgi:hypothetical protein